MFSDILTVKEDVYSRRAIEELGQVDWAAPLLRRIEKSGGVNYRNKPLEQ